MSEQNNSDRAVIHFDRGLNGLGKAIVTRNGNSEIGRKIWDGGLGEVFGEFLVENGVPRGGVPVVDIARQIGLLKGKTRK